MTIGLTPMRLQKLKTEHTVIVYVSNPELLRNYQGPISPPQWMGDFSSVTIQRQLLTRQIKCSLKNIRLDNRDVAVGVHNDVA